MSTDWIPRQHNDLARAEGAVGTPRSETVVQVGELTVTLSVCVLTPEEREPVAASVAWLAAASAVPAETLKTDAWHALIETVLSPYIAITVDHECPEGLGGAWCDAPIRAATISVIHTNALEDLVRLFLRSIDAQARHSRAVS